MSSSSDLIRAKQRLFGCELSPNDTRNLQRFNAWCLAWALAFVAATLAFARGGVAPFSPAAWLLVAVPTAAAVQVLRAYHHFLREADELQRKIHLEALALGFGVGVVFMMSARLLSRAGLPELDVNDGIVVMALTFAFGIWRASRRYA